jgi:O-antigen ligase
MRRAAWFLLLVFAFAIPWEYSLDLGGLLGNAARIAGLLVLLATVLAVLQAGRMRTPGVFWVFTLAFFLWFCLSYFWTLDSSATLEKIRGYFQEMMIVWLIWELAETPSDLRALLRATVAGSWILALLTLAAFSSPEAVAAGQIRFAAYGQDPNEVARFLDLGFPLAALLVDSERRWPARLLALGFFPLGIFAVLLTASREGLLAAIIGIVGSIALLTRARARRAAAVAFALPPSLIALWLIVPTGTLARLATIPEQLRTGDLNQRFNIWIAGWRAFVHAPILGAGAGSFVVAAHLSPIDTAHNTALSIAVTGGLCALFLAAALVVLAVRCTLLTRASLRMALVTSLLVWVLTSFVATVEENRTTWLLLAIVALAGRLASDDPVVLATCFSARPPLPAPTLGTQLIPNPEA